MSKLRTATTPPMPEAISWARSASAEESTSPRSWAVPPTTVTVIFIAPASHDHRDAQRPPWEADPVDIFQAGIADVGDAAPLFASYREFYGERYGVEVPI